MTKLKYQTLSINLTSTKYKHEDSSTRSLELHDKEEAQGSDEEHDSRLGNNRKEGHFGTILLLVHANAISQKEGRGKGECEAYEAKNGQFIEVLEGYQMIARAANFGERLHNNLTH